MYCPVSRKARTTSTPKIRCNLFIEFMDEGVGRRLRSVARGRLKVRARAGARERDAERGAFARRALDGDVAGVLLYDAVGDGEAEARAAPDTLGREERVVNLGDVLGRDAHAGVGDFDDDGLLGG